MTNGELIMIQDKLRGNDYKNLLEIAPRCCVDLMIHHQGKILLVYRADEPAKNTWFFPGSRVYKNEKLEDCAFRIGVEELGLNVEIERKIGVYERMFSKGPFDDLNSGAHDIAICFLVKLENGKSNIKLDETNIDYRWIEKIEEDLHPYVKEVLKDAKIF